METLNRTAAISPALGAAGAGISGCASTAPSLDNADQVAQVADSKVVIGTLTLEATLDSGYLGNSGTIERFAIGNDCSSDCNAMLTALGIADASRTTSLVHWNMQVASTN